MRTRNDFFTNEEFENFKKKTEEETKHYTDFGIETDIQVRWEEGIDHHKKSLELMDALKHIDYYLGDDCFCWKIGGDGDNGENLMYEMDIYFEYLDKLKEKNDG